MRHYKVIANECEYAELKGTTVYPDLLEVDGKHIRTDIGNCIIALKRRVEANNALANEIFSPKDMVDCVLKFLGEYVTITETEE